MANPNATAVVIAAVDLTRTHPHAPALDVLDLVMTLVATSNSPTCGHSNSPRQDSRIMGFLTLSELIARVPMLGAA